MDWGGWAVFGLVATVALTTVTMLAQAAGRTRMDLPMILGTVLAADPDRARAVGFGIHLIVGQVFALLYAAIFASLHRSGWLLGATLGLAHAAVALGVLLPLLPGAHPRMASDRAGPRSVAVLEPPGRLGLSYGRQTPLITVAAHLAYGIALGLLLHAR